jgi:hypothetical protein
MNKNSNEVRRVPGFTAEKALEHGAATPYAGLASRVAGGSGVAPASICVCVPRAGCYCWHYPHRE